MKIPTYILGSSMHKFSFRLNEEKLTANETRHPKNPIGPTTKCGDIDRNGYACGNGKKGPPLVSVAGRMADVDRWGVSGIRADRVRFRPILRRSV